MNSLELKVPPPVVALFLAVAMWGVSTISASIDIPDSVRHVVTATFALLGGCIDVAAIVSFRLARTSINPLKPQNTSSLVTAGIYMLTRNPMYLGLVFVLLAWAAFLSSAWALVGPVAFVLFINRFQIQPEERVMAAKFDADYAEYKAKVRRWL